MPDSTFLTRVVLENYKSIQHCDVQMRPLMFLVGPNGAGKSNFLDALHFVSDALNTSLDHAVRLRNGIKEVRHRSKNHAGFLSMRLDFQLPTGTTGYYTFRIETHAQGGMRYKRRNAACIPRQPMRKKCTFALITAS